MSFKEPFIAICRASDLEAAKRSGAVSDLIPKETLHDFVAFPPGMEDTIAALGTIYAPERLPHMHTDIRADVPEDFVAFTTVHAPDSQYTFRYGLPTFASQITRCMLSPSLPSTASRTPFSAVSAKWQRMDTATQKSSPS